MAEICVLCGKSYKKKVTTAHLVSHKTTARTYKKKAAALPEAAWAEYWGNENLQRIFPKPLKARKKVWKGFKTFEDWGRARHPEWW
jgi:hypothetical protein